MLSFTPPEDPGEPIPNFLSAQQGQLYCTGKVRSICDAHKFTAQVSCDCAQRNSGPLVLWEDYVAWWSDRAALFL